MFTRTRKSPEADITPQVLNFPKKVQADIENRGFHLYKWISPEEVKLSIERDFLATIKIIGIPLAVISVISGLISPMFFLSVILLGILCMFLYLGFLSFKRSSLLSKSAFVVLTDSSISLGWKIHKLSDISKLHWDIKDVGNTFEEWLFKESWLETSKKRLGKEVMDQLFWGYEKIFNGGNRFSGDSEKAILMIIALYTLYVGIMAVVYFVWVTFLWIFGKIITSLNTSYLIWKGNRVMKINNLFGKLDIASENIKVQKRSLSTLLTEAQRNEWKDGLLLDINSGIKDINITAETAVEKVLELRKTIQESRYKEMFSFGVYNDWIKKQISKPLEQIQELLENNLLILKSSRDEIQSEIKKTRAVDHQSALELQLQRIEMQIRDTTRFIPMLEESLKKLQS